MNAGLIHSRIKGKRAFSFLFEGGARAFAEFLDSWHVPYTWVLDLTKGENRITIQ